MTPFYLALILISLVSFVAGQLLLKHAMESTVDARIPAATFRVNIVLRHVRHGDLLFPHARPPAKIRPELHLSRSKA